MSCWLYYCWLCHRLWFLLCSMYHIGEWKLRFVLHIVLFKFICYFVAVWNFSIIYSYSGFLKFVIFKYLDFTEPLSHICIRCIAYQMYISVPCENNRLLTVHRCRSGASVQQERCRGSSVVEVRLRRVLTRRSSDRRRDLTTQGSSEYSVLLLTVLLAWHWRHFIVTLFHLSDGAWTLGWKSMTVV